MIRSRSIRVFLFTLVMIAIIESTFSEPVPINKKTEAAEKTKSNTRHDHSSSANECQYSKGTWSECNPTSNTKTRTLTLKKGQDESKCEKTKTLEKKCKKICKYDKGAWSKCNTDNEMTRTDVLRNPNQSDPSCEKSKVVRKTCKNKAERPGKGQKRKHKQQEQQNGKNKSKQK